MAVDIYLTFNGNCREAVEFIQRFLKQKNLIL